MAFKMKAGKEGPMRKNFGSALNFNAGLRKASKEGKLDNNPKFKAAVDNAPVKMKKKSPKKFIGKAIKGVKKFAQKNPGAATAIGALAAGPIGAIAARRLSKTKLHKGKDRSNQKIA